MSYYDNYIKYKTKYIKLKKNNSINETGGSKLDIVILHYPTVFNKPLVPDDMKPIVENLSELGVVHNYFFKFSYYGNKFSLEDLEFENVVENIYDNFKELDRFILIAINHACPYGLCFADKYPEKVIAIVCYPFRFYCKESYDRRIWKLKENKGFELLVKDKKYDVDNYLLNINEDRFSKLFNDPHDDEKQLIYLVMDVSLQRQYYKIPTLFKTLTYLYTRLDLDVQSVIKYNYERKEIAKMKQIISKDDALLNSMVWNFDRIKYDAELKKENENNKFLKIKYLITGWEDYDDIVDNVIVIIYKKNKLRVFE